MTSADVAEGHRRNLEGTLLADQVRLVLAGAEGWSVADGDFWFAASPDGQELPAQGWKLHVSATALSAPLVTLRAAEVLVAAGCAFKVARGLKQVTDLLSVNAERGASGKVITAYPRDDGQFVELAERLHRATEYLPGPAILSDRAYRPGSLVHYRYGAFTGHTVLTNEGSYESRLRSPDGRLERDRRDAGFHPPAWAACPLEDMDRGPRPGEVVLHEGRFVVRRAIRHGNKGGVYLAEDRQTGAEIVIKQARPHIGGLLDGRDARDLLHHEAELLERLSATGLTARPVAVFGQDGHLFLAQEKIAGPTLAAWVHAQRSAGPVRIEVLLPLVRGLVQLVARLHAKGLVLRDLTPNNVIVAPDGMPRLVDLELATRPGAVALVAGTPGFAAPEQTSPAGAGDGFGAAPGQAADLYSLGAVLLFSSACVNPALAADQGVRHRTLGSRLARLIRLVAASNPATRVLGPAIVGLLADDPARRWTIEQVRTFLATLEGTSRPAVVLLPEPEVSGILDGLLTDGLTHLVGALRPNGGSLWPTTGTESRTDPRNVQFGAGGVLAVLTRAARALERPDLTEPIRVTARWLDQRLPRGADLLPGLHHGNSGSVWALWDAARLLGDEELARRALARAVTVPVRWSNPDICHGAAGAGTAQLALWRATGDEAFLDRARDCADGLLAAASWRDGLVQWTIPADFSSALAGLTHFGFAHGVAGIGAFLLAAAEATGDRRHRELADEAARTLHARVLVEGELAWWPTGEERDISVPTRMAHWCSGSSGVGTFLLRHWVASGDPRSRELAEAAGATVRASRWQMSGSVCHGLAGDGELLLDLADALGEPRYRAWAGELAECLDARAVLRDGLRVVATTASPELSLGYGTGLAGALSFLLRLGHGGARPWMADGSAAAAALVSGGAR